MVMLGPIWLLLVFIAMGCVPLSEEFVAYDPETGETHTIGAQGEVATSLVCADGDYVPTPFDGARRAAECYNRGQQNAFSLLFEYSGGKYYTGYGLEDNIDDALRTARYTAGGLAHGFYIGDGKVHIVTYGGWGPFPLGDRVYHIYSVVGTDASKPLATSDIYTRSCGGQWPNIGECISHGSAP